jgi:1-acyl-sn-glycerol-3-phosphate acyltransferase
VGDAEIIPLGTRGRPGRGTGSSTPSSSSRSLAPGSGSTTRAAAREQHPSVRVPAQKRAEPKAEERAEQTPEQTPEKKAGKTAEKSGAKPAPKKIVQQIGKAETLAEPPADAAEPTALTKRAPATTDHRHPSPGIPPLEWLAAFTSAAKEIFGENWEPRLAHFLAFLRRRLTGEFSVDEYGFDREVTEQFLAAALRPIARRWFRVEVRGAENIPAQGGALVVSNHSGTVPVDGLMTAVSIHDHTGRFLRPLGADLVFKLPIVGDVARKGGATLACTEDAERMLGGGELVGVWPEGFKGIGKPFSERYKLQRFGRGGFVSAAIRAGVPIIPTSVVGAEEIYPLVGNIPSLARLLGVPYIPITPLFPLLGPLGLIPLPSKWLIEFGEPIRTDDYDEGAADDPMLVFNVTDQVRESIQQTLYTLLMQRKSVFS